MRAKVQEGVSASSPARTSLGVACSEAESLASQTNATLELPTNTDYANGNKYIESVTVAGVDASTATVTIDYNTAIPQLAGGQVVYTGTCRDTGTTWAITATGGFPTKYLPKE
ncbi:pilin [Methylophaga sp. OBS4]|nr:pilin [Methylophaga sp. OBS4]